MNIEVIRELTQKLQTTGSICAWSQLYAALTWNKVGFTTRSKVIRISEISFTQDLVFNFWMMASDNKLPVKIYESTNEKANGNDLEIFIETDDGYLLFPTQCKLIKRNGTYPTITHKVRTSNQIDLLIDYAKQRNAVPLYLFYNWYPDIDLMDQLEFMKSYPMESYGCTLASAINLKEKFFGKKIKKDGTRSWLIPDFKRLHPSMAFPWHFLMCAAESHLISSFMTMTGINNNSKLHYYSWEEMSDHELWTNLAPKGIGYIPGESQREVMEVMRQKPAPVFIPAYRIIISKDDQNFVMRRNRK